ncbi:hypothetical protein Kpol_1018p75 [Vanderwaltozyma polyspora DSM 70294]|uniref:Rab-GAP TBC domain-containing protein n=1 Tax=Vanderwaltozyma polyspora (strain ATCC 22028 / DSM 70294 / BCRC 21397 / CBS 2163 / NBRC 10782 / NRRL Y-8283 / UCD 57-17) TaxID=436907 RepID=A7TDS3_VANPO|nr:uncharacterized protein Kpol_1018p75 [Vanderwaltozyma polyspora DSM 70294]EDO19543.1 hypothetical protein Kpol_1018p75 [Vanderwaltozyma polyspora DSM 70294]
MGLRTTSKEMDQKSQAGPSGSNKSSVSLVSSLMRSWKITSNPSSQKSSNSNSNSYSNLSGNSSGDNRLNSGNFDAMSKQQTAAIKSSSSYSPLRYSTPVSGISVGESPRPLLYSNHRNGDHESSIKKDAYFKDLDEDWSAVIDDYNMPIPTIANGGISRSNSDNLTSTSLSKAYDPSLPLSRKVTNNSMKSSSSLGTNITQQGTAQSSHNLSYPQLPQLQKSVTSELKLQLEMENERELQKINSIMQRITKFDCIVSDKKIINQQELRQISWNGIPSIHRPKVWKLLIGYLPANTKRQESLARRKRQEYKDGIKHIFTEEHARDVPTWHQIEIDIPRTNPHIPLYQFKSVQNSLQRILYLWAIRHPASGYVQGINDIVTPFFQTFLTEYLPHSQIEDVEKLDPESYMTEEQIGDVEADTFWCLTKLLEQITDNYIHGQPGILKQVKNLSQLVKRIDVDLYNHFEAEHVEFIQFAFRWMNCLLLREFNMSAVIRMWDTYLAETSVETSSGSSTTFQSTGAAGTGSGESNPHTPLQPTNPTFQTPGSDYHSPSSHTNASSKNISSGENNRLRYSSLNEFHVFVCAAFLIKWSDKLMDMDFQEIITFLQNPPTAEWNENDIEMLLSEAYIWQSLYKDATSHWQ